MARSAESRMGQAAEHFVAADLLRQGFDISFASACLPYDLIADNGSRLLRVQVKSTGGFAKSSKSENVYRFGLRRARGSTRRVEGGQVDVFAFVAWDIKQVAYLSASEVTRADGCILILVEFKTRQAEYRRKQLTSARNDAKACRFVEDFAVFPGAL